MGNWKRLYQFSVSVRVANSCTQRKQESLADARVTRDSSACMTMVSCIMGFRLAPKSMTLDDFELDGGRPPLFSNTYTSITPAVYTTETWRLVLGWGFRLSLDFFVSGLHTRTAVARLPLRQLVFLVSFGEVRHHCRLTGAWRKRHNVTGGFDCAGCYGARLTPVNQLYKHGAS